MTAVPVRYDLSDAVATITLDRPQARNSLTREAKQALREAVDRAAADPAVRCVVLLGTGGAFSVGQDLREHAADLAAKTMDEVWSTVAEHYAPIAAALATMPKPTVAAVNGIAAGAGMSLACCCDIRLVAEGAGFNTAFTGIALSCDTGLSWTLPRLVGYGLAVELLLRPRTVGAKEALEIGLAHRVVPADRLAAAAAELARELAAGPTQAYAAVKSAVAYSASSDLAASLGFEAELMKRTGSTADHRRAVAAFLAKQRPTFDGS